MANGTIKNLVSEKGYGFILGEDGKDYFFHHSQTVEKDLFKSLQKSDPVFFEVEASGPGSKGPRAIQVTRA